MLGIVKQAAVVCVVMAFAAVAGATTIIQADNFVSSSANGDSGIPVVGTQMGLTTNLPNGNWVWGAGWNWGSPQVFKTWMGNIHDKVSLQQEKTALALSMGSYNTGAITIAADLFFTDSGQSTEAGGVGFWSTVPPRDDAQTSTTGFTGITLQRTNGTMQLWVNGTASGSPVSVGGTLLISAEGNLHPYNLSYSIDTADGSISDVLLNGTPISGFTSTGFTGAATANTGIISLGSSNGIMFDNLVVSVPEPASILLLALGGSAVLLRRRHA